MGRGRPGKLSGRLGVRTEEECVGRGERGVLEKKGVRGKWADREDTARAKAEGEGRGESQGVEPF